MKKQIALLLLLTASLFTFTACETIRSIADRGTQIIESNPLIAKTAVQYGTLRFIDGSEARQDAVLKFIEDSRGFINATAVSRVDELANRLKENVNWESLSIANTQIINTLFDTVESYVKKRVEGEDLSPDSILTIQSVLTWIEEAAALSKMGVYAPVD